MELDTLTTPTEHVDTHGLVEERPLEDEDSLDRFFQPDDRYGMFYYKGVKCSVPRGKYNEFYGTYCRMVAQGGMPNVEAILTEASTIVLEYEGVLDIPKAVELCERIQKEVAKEYTVDTLSDNYLGCIVTVGANTSRIYMPNVRVVVNDFNTIHFHNMIPGLDEGVYNLMEETSLPMYGSDDQEFLCCVIDFDCKEGDLSIENSVDDLSQYEHSAHTKVENDVIKATMFADYEYEDMPQTMWLPMVLSPDYWRTVTYAFDKAESTQKQVRERRRQYPDLDKFMATIPITDDKWTISDYENFLNMWDANRLFHPVYWTDVGKAFKTYFRSNPARGLTAWVTLLRDKWKESRKDNLKLVPDLVRRACTKEYRSFGETGVDIKTLAWYGRMDSPVEYYKWHDEWFMQAFGASFRCTHRDIARAFYRLYWLDIVAITGDKQNIFYKFQNHGMRRDYGARNIKSLLNNDFLLQYNRFRSDVADAGRATTAGQDIAKMAFIQLDKVIDSLGNYGFKNKVIGELADMFHVENLAEYMDQDRNLTLLKNGVTVVADGKLHFRAGKPQDYLSTSFGGYYREEYSWDHPDVLNALEWATITFVDPDTITFFWKYLASMFIGGNHDKKLVFFSGKTGNNMKTTWQHQITLVLGERCISMPMNYYTMGKGKADAATPALIRLVNGVRLMFSEEPEATTPIMVSIAKAIVGNDKVFARGNYQDGREFIPQTKAAIICNTVPPIEWEPAMEERVYVLEYKSTVKYGAPTDVKEQFRTRTFPRDPNFDSNLVGMVDAITWIMYQFFPIWWAERLVTPPETVKKATMAYWNSVDRYSMFFKDYIIKEDGGDGIDTMDLYSKFYRWHSSMFKKLDIPDKETVVEAMTKKFGEEPKDGVWADHSFRVVKQTNQR